MNGTEYFRNSDLTEYVPQLSEACFRALDPNISTRQGHFSGAPCAQYQHRIRKRRICLAIALVKLSY